MKIKIYTQLTESIIKEWTSLWGKSPYANIVNSPAWFISGCEAMKYKELRIPALYTDENTLVAIAGFVKTNVYGMPLYTVPAVEFADKQSLLFDFNDQIITDTFLSEILKLGNIYITECSQDIKDSISHKRFYTKQFPSSINSYITLSENSYGDFSHKKRVNVTNRGKKVGKHIEMIHTVRNHIKTLDLAFQIEIASTKEQNGKAVFDREDAKQFYRALAQNIPQHIVTSILYFGEQPVGYSIGFLDKKGFNWSQKAHLPEYNYYHPGKLLALGLLDHCNEKGYEEFNMGRGYDRFKMDFSKTKQSLYNVVVSRNFFIRLYISSAYQLREKVYDMVVRHQKTYVKYRNVKKKLFMKKIKGMATI